jgi:hypothetical protein
MHVHGHGRAAVRRTVITTTPTTSTTTATTATTATTTTPTIVVSNVAVAVGVGVSAVGGRQKLPDDGVHGRLRPPPAHLRDVAFGPQLRSE